MCLAFLPRPSENMQIHIDGLFNGDPHPGESWGISLPFDVS